MTRVINGQLRARCSLLLVGSARLWPARQRARRIALLSHQQQLAAVADGLSVRRRLRRRRLSPAAFGDISPRIAGFSAERSSQTSRVIVKFVF
jgi:hypothetical protein